MRKVINFNTGWHFAKDFSDYPEREAKNFEEVNLPHCYNGRDGQDGGDDYFRGQCLYLKEFYKSELPSAEEYFLEILGINSVSRVYLNGKFLSEHKGGYSAYRVELTEDLNEEKNTLAITVDNSVRDDVYPAFADFTFYGGIYRSVNIIAVGKTHFELIHYATPGLKVTPTLKNDGSWDTKIRAYTKGKMPTDIISYEIYDASGAPVASYRGGNEEACINLKKVTLWHGKRQPYLYTVRCVIYRGGKALDEVSCRIGYRSFEIDPERGFILNGEEYPLRGVSRHQDRPLIGNALKKEHHREDISLILELGASAVRLAHYQHDQYFYDLCDEYGLVVWAEIPYISKHKTEGCENAASQLTELIIQNYNHPSIVIWGLSNEITMGGEDDASLIETHEMLNNLAKSLDSTRKTAVAAISMANPDCRYLKIPDVIAYNHYFGWYGGDVSMNGPWFDEFHKKYPNVPIGVSEYGCEGLDYHTENPVAGDYTEEYQAYYHESLASQLFSRKYLFATYVWNMFDFGADARGEGGEPGQNHKGLVNFDRSYKKDAFYIYKAYLSDEKFIHIASKRYRKRTEDVTRVKVYSNLSKVTLYRNGIEVGAIESDSHIFTFEVENEGKSELVAIGGECRDECIIERVSTLPDEYILKDTGTVLNWFEVDSPDGYFSLRDTLSEIIKTEDGKRWFSEFSKKLTQKTKKDGAFALEEGMLGMISGFTVLRLLGLLSAAGISLTKEELLSVNRELNEIKRN